MTRPNNMKPVLPDAVLAAIVGPEPIQRTEIMRRLWAYIHEHGLQDLTDRRKINADLMLEALFDGAKSATMFELARYIAHHVTPIRS
jgi:chromatin remodeling complex protein RSC6